MKKPDEELLFREIYDEDVEIYPVIKYLSENTLPCRLKDIVQGLIKDAGFKGLRDLGESLEVNTSLRTLLQRSSVPSEGKRRIDYIKVWNWVIENILIQASAKESLSIKVENAIQRAR